MEAAAAFMAVRPRSVAEARRRLRRLGYRDVLIEQVIERLLEMGYLDDADFARAWVESRDRARPKGEIALRRELQLKGVAADTVAKVLDERAAVAQGNADLGAGMALLERRRTALRRVPDERKRRQKAYALLARNGFDPEVCRAASTAFVAGEDAAEN